MHASVKENIVFNRPWNAERYRLALEASALIEDIRAFSGGKGDETEIGEKGLNLSGGNLNPNLNSKRVSIYQEARKRH